jgi:hypothetical protein
MADRRDEDPPRNSKDLINGLFSGNEDQIKTILRHYPFRLSGSVYSSNTQIKFGRSQQPPAGQGNFHISLQLSNPQYAELAFIGDDEDMLDNRVRAGFLKRTKLFCPDTIDPSQKKNIESMLVEFQPGQDRPFLILTKVLDITTICFMVEQGRILRIGKFTPTHANGTKKVQSADELTDYLKECAIAPNRAGSLYAYGPKDFRRRVTTKSSISNTMVGKAVASTMVGKAVKLGSKFGGNRVDDKCIILILWTPEQGWRIYAQCLKPPKQGWSGGLNGMITGRVVRLYPRTGPAPGAHEIIWRSD